MWRVVVLFHWVLGFALAAFAVWNDKHARDFLRFPLYLVLPLGARFATVRHNLVQTWLARSVL